MSANNDSFEPSIADVLVVREMLASITFKTSDEDELDVLPFEIINMIIDAAEYWPHSTAELDWNNDELAVRSGDPEQENNFLLRSKPLGFFESDLPKQQDPMPVPVRTEHPTEAFQDYIFSRWHASHTLANPCRKVVFTLVSHDQGWGGARADHGTYNGSYTWFDAGLERFDADGADPELMSKVQERRRQVAEEAEQQRQRRIAIRLRGPRRIRRGGFPMVMPEVILAGPSNLISEQETEPQPEGQPSDQPGKQPAERPEETPKPDDESQQDKGKAAEENPEPVSEHQPWGIDGLHTVLPPIRLGPAGNGNNLPSFTHTLLPEDYTLIQRNVTATREFREHRVVWSYLDNVKPTDTLAQTELEEKGRGRATGDGSFVRDLKLGDVVTVWGKSRFPGWCNHVQKVKIEVYWAL